MVNTASIIFICIAFLMTTIVPIGVIVWYCIRHRSDHVWLAALLGAVGFFVPQMLIRIPILSFLSMNKGFMNFVENHYLSYALILAFTAAIFELAGRFGAAKILDRTKLTLHKAMAAGLAHGLIEVVIIVGINYINNILYAVMINTGTYDTMITQTVADAGMDTAQYELLKETLISTPAPMYLLGVYERGMTVICHLFMSLIVCYFVAEKRPVTGVLICLAIHTLLDAAAGICQGLATPYLDEVISTNTMYVLVEGFITLVAIVSLFGILRIRKKWGVMHE